MPWIQLAASTIYNSFYKLELTFKSELVFLDFFFYSDFKLIQPLEFTKLEANVIYI